MMWGFASNAIASIGLKKNLVQANGACSDCSDDEVGSNEIKIPFFISCPWCYLLSLWLVYRGNLKFPRKNLFLLWMVESLNGDWIKFGASSGENQSARPPRYNLILGNQAGNSVARRSSYADHPEQYRSHNSESRNLMERHPFSHHKSLDFFIHFSSKFPLVVIFLLIVFFVTPGSAIVLLLYFLVTVIFAIPSLLVLYFTLPTLEKLMREITS
ncbi:hypothetical protein SLE2022_263720 [Rubroshorea leprosula]